MKTLSQYYKTAKRPFNVIDDISLEDYTAKQIEGEITPLDESWSKIAVKAIENCGDHDKVYIAL